MSPFKAVLFTIIIFCAVPIPARAQDITDADLRRAADRIAAVQGIDTLMQTCPADTKGSRTPWLRWLFNVQGPWALNTCSANFDQCLDACTKSSDGTACRAVARVVEANNKETYDLTRRQGYTLACALGNASGCTNRGANLRNAISEIDPYSQTDAAILEDCHTRLFAAACTDGDAWGCAMEGQARRLGEGGPQDIGIAIKRLNKACTISNGAEGQETGAAPCRFAKRQLELIQDN